MLFEEMFDACTTIDGQNVITKAHPVTEELNV